MDESLAKYNARPFADRHGSSIHKEVSLTVRQVHNVRVSGGIGVLVRLRRHVSPHPAHRNILDAVQVESHAFFE